MFKTRDMFLKTLFVLAFLFSYSLPIHAQETTGVINFKEPFRLKGMQAIETSDGSGESWYIGGSGHLIIKTRDNRIEKRISDSDLNSIFVVNSQTVFVVGSSGELLVTKNRGEIWEKIDLGTKVNLESIFCLNQNKCWIVGDKEGIFISGGINAKWQVENIVSNGELSDVYFINEKVGFTVGRNNLLLKTDDGGKKWRRISLSYETKVWGFADGLFWLEAVSFLNDKIGCVAGWDIGSGLVACTKDQGKTWKTNLIDARFENIVWKSEREVYLIDKYGKNYISKDAGINWEIASKK